MASKTQVDINQDRGYIYGTGAQLGGQAGDASTNANLQNNFYRNYATSAYAPLVNGEGGYTSDQASAIRNDPSSLLPTQAAYDSNQLTDDEVNAVRGTPWDRAQFYNPDKTSQIQADTAASQRNAAGGLRTSLYNSIDPKALAVSEDYNTGVKKTLGSEGGNVRAAVNDNRLLQDSNYAGRVRMTPQQQQDIVTGAGISAGTGYRATAGDIDRQAQAAGVDPVGAAAMKERLLREGAGEAGDAMTKARVDASNAAAAREQDIEKTRQADVAGAAQLQSGSELALGSQALGAENQQEALRLSSARDLGNRNMQAGSEAGQADITNERAIAGQEAAANQYNQDTGTKLATGIEADTQARNAAIAQNRQTTNLTNQGNQYNRAYSQNQDVSGREKTIADMQQAQAGEGRNYLTHQSDVTAGQSTADANRQAGLYGTTGNLAEGSTGQQATQDNKPKWWESLTNAAIGGVGAAAGLTKAVKGG